MAEERGAENESRWWRTVPAMLTAGAAFIGSVVALLTLFLGLGGSGGDSNGEGRGTPAPTSTSTDALSVPLMNGPASEEDVRKLLKMVPASLRSRCKQAQEEGGGYLARFSCDIGGATFYYELYRHELDAQDSFSTSASNEDMFAKGHARSCSEVQPKRPFVGTWTRAGQPSPAGQQLCSFGFGDTGIYFYWTETGRPIVGSMYYFGQNPDSARNGAQRVWDVVMG